MSLYSSAEIENGHTPSAARTNKGKPIYAERTEWSLRFRAEGRLAGETVAGRGRGGVRGRLSPTLTRTAPHRCVIQAPSAVHRVPDVTRLNRKLDSV